MSLKSKYKIVKLIHNYLGIGYVELASSYIHKRNVNLDLDNNRINVRVYDLPSVIRLSENNWKIVSSSEDKVTWKSSDNTIVTCRTNIGFDFGHLSEIFLEKVYGTNFNNQNILDIGMSNGDSSIYFAKEGAKRVIGIEPDSRSFLLATTNIKASKVEDKVTILNKAVSETRGDIKLIVYDRNPNANSIEEGNMVKIKDTKHEEIVKSLRLKDIIDMFDGEQIYLLKMDCEGCEYSVLKALDTNSYSRIKSIIMEYHNGLQFLRDVLESNGFVVNVIPSNDKIGYIKAEKKTFKN
jgi:FkbM family methyltransferase